MYQVEAALARSKSQTADANELESSVEKADILRLLVV